MSDVRILLLANNWVGYQIAKYLRDKKENVVGLGIHSIEKQKFTKEILDVFHFPKDLIFDGKNLRNPLVLERIRELKPDIVIAAFWGYILMPEFTSIPPMGCINFHPGFLPYNRGMNPNVWPFIDGSPAGVTLHYITEKIDGGDIIAQKRIPITMCDTAGSLEKKTWYEIVNLFKNVWSKIKIGSIRAKTQNNKKATFHLAKDVNTLDEIFLNKTYAGAELINILRARSYEKRSFAYFKKDGKKIFVRLELSLEE